MTSLVISTADFKSGNLQKNTISNINPSASDANLKSFALLTASLSKDSFVKAVRVLQSEL